MDQELTLGFDAGNYAAAYEDTDLSIALAKLSMNRTDAYVAAFTLGFLSSLSYEELGGDTEAYDEAMNSRYGQRCFQLGFIESGVDSSS
jgi:hypothetical protein